MKEITEENISDSHTLKNIENLLALHVGLQIIDKALLSGSWHKDNAKRELRKIADKFDSYVDGT